MKLHRLEIENLNALEGTHVIDFDADFSDAPLLLICGDTGAGKSTILDAVHLALFGCTPRLTSTSSSRVEAHSVASELPANAMTHGTAQCSSLLEFSVINESGHRERYKALWLLRRARGRADGAIQPVEREIYRQNVLTGDWDMLSKGTKVGEHEEAMNSALRGMKAEEFQRVIMLAQGRFDALLIATPKDRAAILERVIDVSKFKRIGQRVSECWSESRAKKQALESTLSAAKDELLTDEQIDAYRELMAEQQAKADHLSRERTEVTERLVWGKKHREALQAKGAAAESARLAADALALLAPAAESVAEHRRLDAAWTAFTSVKQAEKYAERLANDHTTALAELDATSKKMVPQQEAFDAAQAAHIAAQHARDAAEPALLAATTAWKVHDESAHALQLAQATWQQHHRTWSDAKTLLEQRQKAATAADDALKAAVATRDGFRLPEDALTLAEPLRSAETRWIASKRLWRDAARVLEEQTAREATLRETLHNAREQLATLQKTKEGLLADTARYVEQAGLPANVAARELVVQLREQYIVHKTRAEAAKRMVEAYGRRDALLVDRHELDAELTRQNEAFATLDAARAASEERLAGLAAQRESVSAQIATSDRFVEMVDALVDGHDCPLCGSQQHRDAADRRLEMVTLRAALAERLEEVRRVIAEEEQASRARAADRDALQRTLATLRTKLEQVQAGLATENACIAQHVEDSEATGEAPWSSKDDAQAAQRHEEKRCEAIGAIGTKASELASRVEANDKDMVAASTTVTGVEAQLAGVKEDVERATARHTEQRDEHRAATDTLVGLLTSPALQATSSLDADTVADVDLSEVASRVVTTLQAFASALVEVNRRADVVAACATELRAQQDVVALSAAHELESRTMRDAASAALERAKEVCLTYFDGQHPTQVAALLEGTKKEAMAAFETARAALTATQSEVTALQGKVAACEAQRKASEAACNEEKAQFNDLLASLGVDSRETLQARRLDEGTLAQLTSRLEDARQKVDEHRVRVDECQKRLDEILAQLPATGAPQDDDAERAEALEQEHKAAVERLAEARERLRVNDERKSKHAEDILRLQRAAEDFEVWTQLNLLVGANKGAAFSDFALALSLQDLIWRANHQLKDLAPRYLLEQRVQDGRPMLDFLIIDLDSSSSRRPLTTLSGGERFLISLALALALADTTGATLMVETLMIDEGFGTLDSETLHRAISALEALQGRRGAQVALISHVAGLRERIPAQIRLRKLGGGRSTIDVVNGTF